MFSLFIHCAASTLLPHSTKMIHNRLVSPVSHRASILRCVLLSMAVFLESAPTVIRHNNAGPFVDHWDEEQGRAKY